MSALQQIAMASISVPADRARGLDRAWVEGLAAIIEAEGLIQPIAVLADGLRFQLIAGGHRLQACKALGWETIPATVYEEGFGDADLIETLENLARRELTALDRAKHFARFRTAYEAKHGPIERGGDRKSEAAQDQSPRDGLWSFHEVIAERTGFKRATVFDYLAIWNGLAPGTYDRLSALPAIADNKAQLANLAGQSDDQQDAILNLIETDQAGSVAEALDRIAGIEQRAPDEKRYSAARSAWKRLNQAQRHQFLADNEEEVRLFAKQRGWIDG
jgi:ParB family chromosome partitioning protein